MLTPGWSPAWARRRRLAGIGGGLGIARRRLGVCRRLRAVRLGGGLPRLGRLGLARLGRRRVLRAVAARLGVRRLRRARLGRSVLARGCSLLGRLHSAPVLHVAPVLRESLLGGQALGVGRLLRLVQQPGLDASSGPV